MGSRTHLCPRCRRDLIGSVRVHLYACLTVPANVRSKAQAVRQATQEIVKRTQQLVDRSDLLIREAEAAVAALRETMRMIAGGRE